MFQNRTAQGPIVFPVDGDQTMARGFDTYTATVIKSPTVWDIKQCKSVECQPTRKFRRSMSLPSSVYINKSR